MKFFGLLLALTLARVVAAQSADWSLQKVNVAGPENSYLSLEFISTVQAGPNATLTLDCWPGGKLGLIIIDIDVFASDGTALPKVITTGPALAFLKSATLEPHQKRTFEVGSVDFVITRPGWYVAKGKLLHVSSGDHLIDLPLPDLRFHVETPGKNPPVKISN